MQSRCSTACRGFDGLWPKSFSRMCFHTLSVGFVLTNAGANKLAQLFYRMLKFGAAHVEQGQTYYEERYKERLLHNLSKRAKELGFQLAPCEPASVSVS